MANTAPHAQLHELKDQLKAVLSEITHFRPHTVKPLIIDALESDEDPSHDRKEGLSGLRILREDVKRDLLAIEKFLTRPDSASLPALSTNAPYLVAVWQALLSAPPPVLSVLHTFADAKEKVKAKPFRSHRAPGALGVKVDVVADGGKQWVRVNTMKNSRILAEFREHDSYLTDSESETELDSYDSQCKDHPSAEYEENLADNSLLRMGRSLIEAAKSNPVATSDSGSNTPSVTLILTRLDPSPESPEYDPRIPQTLEALRHMGIDVQVTHHQPPLRFTTPELLPILPCIPTMRLNLDLSMLIALVSDLTHASLPCTQQEAESRFVPSDKYLSWKKARIAAKARDTEDSTATTLESGSTDSPVPAMDTTHSRQLFAQLQQEVQRGLLQEIRDRLEDAARLMSGLDNATGSLPSVENLDGVEFWTTQDARDRCLRIVHKIGGPGEKLRAAALFPDAAGSDSILPLAEAKRTYWSSSRYAQGFLPLVPIHIFPGDVPAVQGSAQDIPHAPAPSLFFTLLADTCHALLSQEPPLPAQAPRLSAGEIERAAVTAANPKLTAHTVQSMLCGVRRGWTTLTANRASVRTLLRSMRRNAGLHAPARAETSGVGSYDAAAIWVVNPRSLAEGMRSDSTAAE